MKRSRTLTLASIVTGVTIFSGCLDKNGGFRGPKKGDDNNSVVAAIEGISDEDIARDGMKYWLACDGDVRVQGTPKADKSAVEFAGDKIKNDMTCAMEIGISEEEGKKYDWEWFGRKDGKPLIGFMYGSNKGKVSNRALTLKLYRVYSPKSSFAFSAELRIALELPEGTEMPADDKTTANLVCSETETYPGLYKKQEDKNAVLTFANLKIKDLKGRSCAKVALLVDNKEAFSGVTDVTFVDPKKDESLKFPTDLEKRYTLKTTEITDGNVNVGTIPGGICLKFELETNECDDVRSMDLGKWPKNYFVAKIMGLTKDGKGETVTFYVGAGASGFGLFEGSKLDVEAINKAARSAPDSGERKAFSFYKSAIQDDLFNTAFDANFVSGKAFESFAAKEEDLADVMMLHVDDVRVHGMHAIKAEDLNKLEKAHWMAVVTAKKDSDEKEFIATGSNKYFYSPSAPSTTDDKPSYLNMEAMLADMAQANGPEKFRAYAMKDGIMADAGCKLEKNAYIAGLSTRHLDQMKAESADTDLDACDVAGDKFSAAVGTGYTFSSILYKFGWFEVTK